jgi:heptose-I-phosphate ethanolaminephosphotransferase
MIFGLWYIPNLYSYLREVVAFGGLVFITSVLSIVVKRLKVRKCSICFFYSILALLLLIKLSFYQLYGAKINASALYVFFETNMSETVDFIADFINVRLVLLFVVVFFPWLFFCRTLLFSKTFDSCLLKLPSFYFNKMFLKVVVTVLVVLSGYVIYSRFQNENILLETYNSFQSYKEYKLNLKNTLAKETTKHLTVSKGTNKKQVYVVIVGESTSRWHMQLYGYNRATTPLLTGFKSELYVFNDVISPHTHTMPSLEKILTLSDYCHPSIRNNASIIQLANQAGFTTYWLSNQRPVGINESLPTMIGSAAKHKYFVNSEDFMYNVQDGKLLPYLDKILSETPQKKMIFIHLMGTHNNYSKRYPEEFNYFSGVNPITKFQHRKSIKQVNMYDNAIRYNDYIVKTIIDKVKKEQTDSYVVYFSDHGDELYDTVNLLGHNEYHGTKPMYDVPFIVWLSEKYKQNRPNFIADTTIVSRKYNLESFFHSFSDLSQIKFEEYNATKSIFSDLYLKQQRLIKKGVDYDKMK